MHERHGGETDAQRQDRPQLTKEQLISNMPTFVRVHVLLFHIPAATPLVCSRTPVLVQILLPSPRFFCGYPRHQNVVSCTHDSVVIVTEYNLRQHTRSRATL